MRYALQKYMTNVLWIWCLIAYKISIFVKKFVADADICFQHVLLIQVRRKGYPEKTSTFDTKAQAETWGRSIESEMDRGVYVDRRESEQTTLAEAIERYKREIIPLKAHPKQECQRVDRWLQNPLAKRYLATLRGFDFAKYRDSRRAEGRA